MPTLEEALGERLRPQAPGFMPRYNICPTQPIQVVRQGEDSLYHLVAVIWGLLPHWAREAKITYSTINARADTVEKKAAFRTSFRRRR